MSDRVLRDELLHSDRWASLPTDTHRLIFVSLLLICDDYGNIEGGPRRLFRWAHGFTQVKTENDMTKIMSDLQDARGDGEQEGMVMRYEVAGKEYWHLCRFTNTRRYWSRKYPKSPYAENEQIETKHDDAKNPSADLRTPLRRPADGVGVGVGVGVGEGLEKNKVKNKGAASRPGAKAPVVVILGDDISPELWAEFLDMRKRIRKPASHHAQQLLIGRLQNLAGNDVNLKRKIIQQSIRNSWQDVFELREEKSNGR